MAVVEAVIRSALLMALTGTPGQGAVLTLCHASKTQVVALLCPFYLTPSP